MNNSLEQKVQRKTQYDAIQKRVSLLLARLTARQGRMLFVPHEILIKQLNLSEDTKSPARKVQQALRRLEQKGLVMRNQASSGWSARLTPKGKALALKLDIHQHLRLKKPSRWDGRWRIVIFDIWERRKPTREKLRRALKQAGFYKVQDSVWAYPYDCEDLLVFLRADLRLGSGILYIIAEGIEGDARIRQHFDL